MSNLTLWISSTLAIYRDAAIEASRGLTRNWVLILGSLIAALIYIISSTLFSNFGMAGGFLSGLIQIALLSLYYSWLSQTVQREKLRFNDLTNFDLSLFFSVISVGFIFFVIEFLISNLITGLNISWILLIVRLGLVIMFNCISEMIYIHRQESTAALLAALEFIKNNWIEWFIPFILISAPLLFMSPTTLLLALSQTEPLLPGLVILQQFLMLSGMIGGWLTIVVGIVITHWFVLFRAHLFRELEFGSRRSRIYRAKL